MFTFANFVQKSNFERSQVQKIGVALTQFYLFVLSLLRVLEESCFKAPKVPLDNFIWTANQMTGFYIKSNTGLKWFNWNCKL